MVNVLFDAILISIKFWCKDRQGLSNRACSFKKCLFLGLSKNIFSTFVKQLFFRLKNKILLFSIFWSIQTNAQEGSISGKISSGENPVPFARVRLNGTNHGGIADSTGHYLIQNIAGGTYDLQVTALGYQIFHQEVTIGAGSYNLSVEMIPQTVELDAVVVTGTMREMTLSQSPVKIEVLSPQFFKVNPVNSIIEALQTVNGVQEQVNCGVCGTNDIHINGMEGPYTLVLIDGMPIVSGLSSVYGFNGIPTSIIQRVEIIKGPSSTLYGTEAVGGVINIITKSPANTPVFDAEIYGNTHQEFRGNVAISPTIGKRLTTSLSADYYYNQYRMDFNQDNFTDIPLNNRISVFNKWQVTNPDGKISFQLAARYYFEDRFGGTLQWTPQDKGSDSVYGESVNTRRLEVIGSVRPGFLPNWRLDFSANNHQQNSYYGIVNYRAGQQVLFSNLIWDKALNRRNRLLIGSTNKYVIYQDNTASATDEKKYVPGLFAQHEFNWTDELVLLTGVRLDYHRNHGLIFSPRLSLKKQFGMFSAMRLNYGTGFREVHLATEDHAFVTGARDVVILEELKPERSHNVTLNFNHTHNVWGYGNLDADLFYTYFLNKIVADYTQDPQLIVYENLSGYGTSRGVSVSLFQAFRRVPLQLRLGVTCMQVFEISHNDILGKIKADQLFVPHFSGTFSIGYEWKKVGLSFNYTGKAMGHQLLPEYDPPFERPTESPWYSLQNFQVTKKFKSGFEIFSGIKNVLNYTQPSPLINPENPYDVTFDTSYAYGPLQPRRYYLGIRYNIPRN